MVATRFYHLVINLVVPGFLSFKRGKYLKGSGLMFMFFMGIDLILLGSTGFIKFGLGIGIALALFSWCYSQWGCFRGFLRSESDQARNELDKLYHQGIQSYLNDDFDAAKRAFENCREVDPFSVPAHFLSGIIERDKGNDGKTFFESATDMTTSKKWKWFISRTRNKR